MGNRRLLFLATGVIAILSVSAAKAEKLCLKTSVNKKTFKTTTISAIAATCPPGYTAIANTDYFVGPEGKTGPQGDDGPQGAVGPQGTQGAVGPQGPQGAVGPQGVQGSQGPAGAKGDTGDTGPQGPAGVGVSLYDSSDALVGPVASAGCPFFSVGESKPMERVSVLLTVAGRTYSVCASLDEFIANADVAFASTGCTGQAYLFPLSFPSTASTLFAPGRVTAAGSQRILYRPDYTTGSSSVTWRSSYNSEGLCTDNTSTDVLFPAIQVSNLSTAYPAPLEVR
jgi:hypothetical protein